MVSATPERRSKPEAAHPLFGDNALKLGVFGLNAGGTMMTLAPDRYVADWSRSDACMALAAAGGLEAMVSLSTWDRRQFEPFTWCTGLGARHPGVAPVATFHVQLAHPTFVAKAVSTGDHVTDGRFAINLVAGSNPATYAAFGVDFEDHDTRYAHAEEFLQLLERLWSSEDPVTFEGRFYNVRNVRSEPKPLARRPPIMNAGTSERGMDFAARHADLVFTHLPEDDLEGVERLTRHYKNLAFSRYRRQVQVWTQAYVVIREAAEEAEAFLNYYAVTHADRASVAAWIRTLGQSADEKTRREAPWKFERNWAAGGGVGLVGTPDQVAEQMVALNQAGVDGILLNSMEPERMLASINETVIPRLQQAGLRRTIPAAR